MENNNNKKSAYGNSGKAEKSSADPTIEKAKSEINAQTDAMLLSLIHIQMCIRDRLKTFKKIDDDLFDELEEVLITADLGVNTSMEIIERLREAASEKKLRDSYELKGELNRIMTEILTDGDNSMELYGCLLYTSRCV